MAVEADVGMRTYEFRNILDLLQHALVLYEKAKQEVFEDVDLDNYEIQESFERMLEHANVDFFYVYC